MTKMKKIGIALTAALALPALALAAPDKETKEGRRADRKEHRAKMVEKYDANDDGKLDAAEREIMHQERIAEHFKQIDANGDGKITFDEFEANAEQRFKERKSMRGKKRHHDAPPPPPPDSDE